MEEVMSEFNESMNECMARVGIELLGKIEPLEHLGNRH